MLEAAYDDSAGVTAEFNRNVLRVVNRGLGADFDARAFEHVAFFDRPTRGSRCGCGRSGAQRCASPASTSTCVRRGEEMRTEICAKFTRERVAADLAAAGLELRSVADRPSGALRALPVAAAPVGARALFPRPARLHVAPAARVVLGVVVEHPAARLALAGLQMRPGAVGDGAVDERHDPAERAVHAPGGGLQR